MEAIRQEYTVLVPKTYTFTESQQIALEFFRRQHSSFGGNSFIVAIKFIRAEFGCGLKEAKDLADVIFERF